MRGFLETEINRVFNRLVETQRPAHLILERLDFRNPNLSRRLNRLVQNCGRGVVNKKLAALEEELGITHSEVPAAYSSQECHKCGYVDKKNRTGEAFSCLWCGLKCHADVNGARTIKPRRSWATSRRYRSKAGILEGLVTKFQAQPFKRQYGTRDGAVDPRLTNHYFTAWMVHPVRIGSLGRGDINARSSPLEQRAEFCNHL